MKQNEIKLKRVDTKEFRLVETIGKSSTMYSIVADSEQEALDLFHKDSHKVSFIGNLTYSF